MNAANSEPRVMSFQYGRTRIEYRLRYAARKTLAIDVHPDLSVVVTAPTGSPDTAAAERVHKRASWIVHQQRFFQTYLPKLPPAATSAASRTATLASSTGSGSTKPTRTR